MLSCALTLATVSGAVPDLDPDADEVMAALRASLLIAWPGARVGALVRVGRVELRRVGVLGPVAEEA